MRTVLVWGTFDWLLVGLAGDAGGAVWPIVPEYERAAVLRALAVVDEVVIFPEPTPAALVARCRADISQEIPPPEHRTDGPGGDPFS